ncbi:hypothetical protein BB560_003029 [Smittium megazygosporum]|uniref:Uncharacterized protein n=1 Tax=Smittium megazygosporum TaxID=133381 RepID=A0A2T9ZD39_9FUNG|nr:hypothetical protein BB560_003029 [Smittium megazygosporum]
MKVPINKNPESFGSYGIFCKTKTILDFLNTENPIHRQCSPGKPLLDSLESYESVYDTQFKAEIKAANMKWILESTNILVERFLRGLCPYDVPVYHKAKAKESRHTQSVVFQAIANAIELVQTDTALQLKKDSSIEFEKLNRLDTSCPMSTVHKEITFLQPNFTFDNTPNHYLQDQGTGIICDPLSGNLYTDMLYMNNATQLNHFTNETDVYTCDYTDSLNPKTTDINEYNLPGSNFKDIMNTEGLHKDIKEEQNSLNLLDTLSFPFTYSSQSKSALSFSSFNSNIIESSNPLKAEPSHLKNKIQVCPLERSAHLNFNPSLQKYTGSYPSSDGHIFTPFHEVDFKNSPALKLGFSGDHLELFRKRVEERQKIIKYNLQMWLLSEFLFLLFSRVIQTSYLMNFPENAQDNQQTQTMKVEVNSPSSLTKGISFENSLLFGHCELFHSFSNTGMCRIVLESKSHLEYKIKQAEESLEGFFFTALTLINDLFI